jgi:hypothetical protein
MPLEVMGPLFRDLCRDSGPEVVRANRQTSALPPLDPEEAHLLRRKCNEWALSPLNDLMIEPVM